MSQRPSPRPARAGKLLPFDRAYLIGSASLFTLALCLATVPAGAQTQASASSASAATPAPTPAPAAKAGTTPPPATPPKPTDTAGSNNSAPEDETVVTITADKPAVQHKPDRDIYDVKQDPVATTGSAADVLNNIPAVTADPDGTVALRGNTNVQIYVDGKKSAEMSGDARAFTLQSLAGSDIDSVEVIPNPPANFGSDSSAGIINIVTKQGRGIPPRTELGVQVGDEGRGTVFFSTGKRFNKLSLRTSINLGHRASGGGRGGNGGAAAMGGLKSRSLSDRLVLDPITGATIRENVTDNINKNDNDSASGNLSATYALTPMDTIQAQISGSQRTGSSNGANHNRIYDGLHNLTSDTTRLNTNGGPQSSSSFSLSWDARGEAGTGNDFKMQWQQSRSWSQTTSDSRTINNVVATPDTFQHRNSKQDGAVDEFSGDFSRQIANNDEKSTQTTIQMGWDLTHSIEENYNFQSLTYLAGAPILPNVPSTKQFNTDDQTFAGYFILQQVFNDKFSASAGLRYEDLSQEILSYNPLTAATAGHSVTNKVNWSPSLFMLYKLGDKDSLRFNWGKKIQRPFGQELDPLIIISEDGLSARSGNPNLRPEERDNFNLNYIHQPTTNSGFDFTTGLNYSNSTGAIERVTTFLPSSPAVVLSTYSNAGTAQQYGFETNGGFATADRAWRINASYNFNYTISKSIDAATSLMIKRRRPNSSGTLRVTYQTPDKKDNIGLNVRFSGENVSLQSRTESYTVTGLTWTHQIIPAKLNLTVTAQNVLESQEYKTFYNSSVEGGFSDRLDPGASVMVNVRYTFGKIIQRQGGGNRNTNGQGWSGYGGNRDGNSGGNGGGGRGGGGGGGRGGGGGGRGGF